MSVAIEKNTVVSLSYELADTDGVVLEKTDSPITYLHGGHHGIFPRVEEALEGKRAGDECSVRLEPEDAFGDYDAQLIRIEARNLQRSTFDPLRSTFDPLRSTFDPQRSTFDPQRSTFDLIR
jgi:FKBP-type peptidyl-prolyl cis-trans isomerase 2